MCVKLYSRAPHMMQIEQINLTPSLVGMSHLCNVLVYTCIPHLPSFGSPFIHTGVRCGTF